MYTHACKMYMYMYTHVHVVLDITVLNLHVKYMYMYMACEWRHLRQGECSAGRGSKSLIHSKAKRLSLINTPHHFPCSVYKVVQIRGPQQLLQADIYVHMHT